MGEHPLRSPPSPPRSEPDLVPIWSRSGPDLIPVIAHGNRWRYLNAFSSAVTWGERFGRCDVMPPPPRKTRKCSTGGLPETNPKPLGINICLWSQVWETKKRWRPPETNPNVLGTTNPWETMKSPQRNNGKLTKQVFLFPRFSGTHIFEKKSRWRPLETSP